MNVFMHPLLVSKESSVRGRPVKIIHMGPVHSANQDRGYKYSVINPAKPKLKTTRRRG